MKYLTTKHRILRHFLPAPFILLAVIPLAILDLYIEFYHRFCFPFYRIPYVKRKNYVRVDRHKLSYLKIGQKINCVYCGYINGIINYWSAIIGETEKYFCSIKHEETEDFVPQKHHQNFIEYSDKEDFEKQYGSKRESLL